MPLWLIGLGLSDEKDITCKGLELVKKADEVYLEAYTSILCCPRESLESFYGREVKIATREFVEGPSLLEISKNKNVALLVAGDPLCATTHSGDLILEARAHGIELKVIHNASILTAIGSTGLQMYRFGETVSIPYFGPLWKPSSFYHKIAANKQRGLHTLCLLDIKIREQTIENMMKGRDIFEPPRFMTVNQAIDQLLEIEAKENLDVCGAGAKAFGFARAGSSDTQLILTGTLKELQKADFGPPLHCLIICANDMHETELKFFDVFKTKN